MDQSDKEVEVKLRFESAELAGERIARLGARVIEPRLFEDNALFDREADSLKPAGKMLRLRRCGSRSLLTFKGPVEGEHRHKVRTEIETEVDDSEALRRILTRLDFVSTYRYQKYRTVFEHGKLHICLDETPLGCFVELEGPPDEIDRVADQLGFAPEQYINESYAELHERAVRESGFADGDLLLEPVERNG